MPVPGQYVRRGAMLIVMVAVVAPLSWKAGELLSRRKAEAARQSEFEESRQLMEEQRDYLRVGATFPDFSLINAADSSVTSLRDQLRGGGMMVVVSPECPSCDEALETIRRGIARVADSPRICIVADSPLQIIREWIARHEVSFPCFQDRDRFIGSAYEYTVIPFVVLINNRFEIEEYSTGGWSAEDYARMLNTE